MPNQVIGLNITPEKIIYLSNKEREEAGIVSLKNNDKLTQAALGKGRDMLKAQIFEHNIFGKKFSAWTREAGYDYSYVGENLAIDFTTSEGIMRAWLSSEEHRKNILNPNYQEIGVAVLEGIFQGQNTILVVQIFGSELRPPVPAEISQRNERLGPIRGEVLSANEYFENAEKLPDRTFLQKIFPNWREKKSTPNHFGIEILVLAGSVLSALFLTGLYLLGLISLINFFALGLKNPENGADKPFEKSKNILADSNR